VSNGRIIRNDCWLSTKERSLNVTTFFYPDEFRFRFPAFLSHWLLRIGIASGMVTKLGGNVKKDEDFA
jgi:hypothetical protein